MAKFKKIGISLFVLVVCASFVQTELHRAKSPSRNNGFNRPASSEQVRGRDTLKNLHNLFFHGYRVETWIFSILSAVLVGLSGIFPLLVIPLEAGKKLREGANHALLNLVLSFAVGSLLGDVFLHLLPEAWAHLERGGDPHAGHLSIAAWVLTGILTFLIIEKVFTQGKDDDGQPEQTENTQLNSSNNNSEQKNIVKEIAGKQSKGVELKNGFHKELHRRAVNQTKKGEGHMANGDTPTQSEGVSKAEDTGEEEKIHVSGYLNLFANVIDNFTHGLAIAGSYIAGTKVGMLTTFAILVHEIPHEVGDFAILLRSGFNRWKAAKAQLCTASGGLLGALTALCAESAQIAGDSVAWILPFTSGGFLYIALVTVVPDLLKETNPRESFKQLIAMLCGVGMMVLVTYLV